MMMTEELHDFDSMCHASISTIGSFDSLHASINSLDSLQDSVTSRGFHKQVTWAPTVSRHEHISRYQMTFEEAQRTWIFAEEKASMMEQHMADLKREQEGLPEEDECAYRGLDALKIEGAGGIRKTIGACVKAVLQEQTKLQGSCRVDHDQLAMVSAQHSQGSTKSALIRAKSDLQAAKEVYEKIDTSDFFKELAAQVETTTTSNTTPTKRTVVKSQKQSPTHFATSRQATNHLEKYTSSQKPRLMRAG